MSDPHPRALPTGTVTFLFTDIEGSTSLARSLGEGWARVLAEHDRRVRAAIEASGGIVVRTEGDSFFGAFTTPLAAVRAAAEAQRAVAEEWPDDVVIRVRMGLHTGPGVVVGRDYVGYEVHRAARVAAAGHGGQVLLSDATRVLVEGDLPSGLGIRDLGTFRLKDVGPQRLHQLLVEGLEVDFPSPRSLEPESNLPAPLSEFVGRGRELTRIEELLGSRLLTLTGSGGTGKTRLALEAARRVRDRFEAISFVDLAPITTPGDVVGTIAAAVGAREDGGRSSVEVLRGHLSGRDFLLILDNFEQVLDAAGDVADLLAACPQLAVIVTSRAPLHLAGEQEFPVPPLGLPDTSDPPAVEELSGYGAIALFVARARAVDPEFSLTPELAPAVAEICARLDGLPLAIELAASRLRSLSPAAILERLDRRLPLLTGGARDLPERQRTLRSTIAWSEDLLDAPHRTLFARLSVFLGEWTLDAAEDVANPSGELGLETLDAVEALRDHGLVRPGPGGDGPWFSMLETIREYGGERLAASAEEGEIRSRHGAHFLALAESAEHELTGPRAIEWRQRLDREQPNIRAALEWSLETENAEVGLRIGAALWRLWQVRGALREGLRVMDALLALPAAAPRTPVRARGLIAAGSLSYWARDPAGARDRYEEALSISQELGDESGIAHGMYNAAFGHALFDEFELAVERLEDSRRRFEALGDERMTAHAMLGLAMSGMRSGRFLPDARRLAVEALQTFEELRELQWISLANGVLAQIAFARGDEQGTILHTRRSMDATELLGDVMGVAVQLQVVAAILGRRGHHERALLLAGAAQAVTADAGGEAPRALIELEDAPTLASGSFSEEQIRALLEEGAQLSADEAVSLARRELDGLSVG